MEAIAIRDVVEAVRGELVRGNIEAFVSGVSTDTRTIAKGDLFFALIGENSDGHNFIPKAVESGAAGVVVSRDIDVPGDAAVIRVPDVLVAYGDLASWYSKRFDVRVVGVTGSVGKTTTKEMIASVVGVCKSVQKNAGNFNNEIGLPLTLFGLKREHEVAVLEMAMRGPGEIKRLCEIIRPDVAVITNIGITHIERLGSRDAIALAKSEILDGLAPDGVAVLNADDDYSGFLSAKFAGKKISYGLAEGADVRAEDIRIDQMGRPSFHVRTSEGRIELKLDVIGEHNVIDALAAVSVGLILGVPLADIADALAAYIPPDKRANVRKTPLGATVLDDTYNASPASVTSALSTLKVMEGSRKIAVLGDMLELGDHAVSAHAGVGKVAAETGLVKLVTVGPLSRSTAEGAVLAGLPAAAIVSFETSEEAGEAIKGEIREGDVVLVKGSRGMKMEKVVEALLS